VTVDNIGETAFAPFPQLIEATRRKMNKPVVRPLIGEPHVIPLSDGEPNQVSGVAPDRWIDTVSRAEIVGFEVSRPRARALVYVGGGYTRLCVEKEGFEVAAWLNGLGVDAYVLVHRLPGSPAPDGGVHPADIALLDASRALDHLDGLEEALPLFHVGLSSGGHLAGVMACQERSTPARGAIIAYAPINANHRAHKFPPGKPDYAPVEKQDFYDAWPIGLAEHPPGLPRIPIFLAYALRDKQVPVEHALRLIETAAAEGLDVDAHIYGKAPHGFALRDVDGTHATWTSAAADWIERRL